VLTIPDSIRGVHWYRITNKNRHNYDEFDRLIHCTYYNYLEYGFKDGCQIKKLIYVPKHVQEDRFVEEKNIVFGVLKEVKKLMNMMSSINYTKPHPFFRAVHQQILNEVRDRIHFRTLYNLINDNIYVGWYYAQNNYDKFKLYHTKLNTYYNKLTKYNYESWMRTINLYKDIQDLYEKTKLLGDNINTILNDIKHMEKTHQIISFNMSKMMNTLNVNEKKNKDKQIIKYTIKKCYDKGDYNKTILKNLMEMIRIIQGK
jgi:hypothetical protein